MKVRMAVGVCTMLLAAVVFVHAAEPGEKKPRPGRLTQRWSKIASLSDEQKSQIRAIHARAVANKKAIEEKEREDIMALLTEEQKAEAQRMLDERKKPRRAPAEGDAAGEKQSAEQESEAVKQ